LGRLEPVARQLLRDVDDALLTLGAPPGHPVWALLRDTGAMPAEVVAFFVDAEPHRLRSAARELRDRAGAYAATAIPTGVPWEGGAGEAYTARAHSLNVHLRSDMTGAMGETASYVEEIASWYERSRDRIARALGEVLSSAQTVTVRTHHAVDPASIGAAADIAAHVLAAAASALDDGRDLPGGWISQMVEVTFRAPVETGTHRFDATIHLDH
jgi:hypothetical protein